MRTEEVVVVGAGPAGLAAAIEARRLGAEVFVLDEYAKVGGQYHKQPLVLDHRSCQGSLDPQVRAGRDLADKAKAMGVRFWTATQVWGLFPGRRLAVMRPTGSVEIEAQRLIIASGAHDRLLAFPGWTLPGVMTPGAAQTLVKAYACPPGQRVVVAGTGPFLLVVTAHLLKAGVNVVAYVEAARWSWTTFFRFTGFPERWGELARYVLTLMRHRVPIYRGSAVIAAGEGPTLSAVTIARLDDNGRPVAETRRQVAADTLAIAQGFRPNCELTGLAGCRHAYEERRGGCYCVIDPDTGVTSVDGIYASGEVTGIGGSRVATEEGRIAGLAAARSLGYWDAEAESRLTRARVQRRREQAFADLVNQTFAPPSGLTHVIDDNTIVCRCEEIRASAIRAAVETGARSATAVKMWTRCSMGRCQGRFCSWSVNRYVAALTGISPERIGVNEPRIPIKPVSLEAILSGGGDVSQIED